MSKGLLKTLILYFRLGQHILGSQKPGGAGGARRRVRWGAPRNRSGMVCSVRKAKATCDGTKVPGWCQARSEHRVAWCVPSIPTLSTMSKGVRFSPRKMGCNSHAGDSCTRLEAKASTNTRDSDKMPHDHATKCTRLGWPAHSRAPSMRQAAYYRFILQSAQSFGARR